MTKNDERKLVKNNGKTTISPIAKEGLVKTVTLVFFTMLELKSSRLA